MPKKVEDLRERKAAKREKAEYAVLTEVNSLVNTRGQIRVIAGIKHAKTLHEGVDLRWALAKYDELVLKRGFHAKRMLFAITAKQDLLIVHMPGDKRIVLARDGAPVELPDFPEKVIAFAEKVGVWEDASQ